MDEASHSPENQEHEEIEKGGIAGPIFLTLFTLVMIAGLVVGLVFRDHEVIQKLFVAPEWWVANIGEYHPIILHLPIGIVFLTLTMEVCSWISFGRYRPVTVVGLFFAFLTGVLACVTGFFDLNVGGYQAAVWDDPWFQHMVFGVIFVGLLGLAFLAKIWGRRNGSRGPVYGILLIGAAGVMGYGAHIGGVKIHKTDPVINTLEGLGLIQGGADSEDLDTVVAKPPKDRLAFAEVVVPILENRCFSCHSEKDDNGKGGLWMDTYENILIGGELQDDEPEKYPTLVPGDAKKSYMIEVLNLPEDDDMHMPPKKKKQMDDHEIEILTWWVSSIPPRKDDKDFDLEDKTLEEMGAPQNILDAVAKMVSPEEFAAMEAEMKAAQDKIDAAKAAKREALQSSLDTLKQDEAFKTSLGYVSQDSTDLAFSAVSLREKMDDDRLAKLAPVAESIVDMGLGSSSVTEAALINELKGMKNLRKLNLSQTQAGDSVLDVVAGLKNLQYLNLYGTQVTDEGLMKLKSLGNLKSLYLWQSKATPAGGEALKKELPGLEVTFGVE
jgi:uncharacterized membrane protein